MTVLDLPLTFLTLVRTRAHAAAFPVSAQLVVVTLALPISVFSLWYYYLRTSNASKAPALPNVYVAGTDGGKRSVAEARKHFVHHCGEIMREGYEKTQGGFFYIPTPAGDRLMIPTKYMEELKNAPDELVDFTGSFLEMFSGKYTTIGVKWHLHPNVVKKDLNANLALILPDVEDEVYHAFQTLLPKHDDWTPVRIADLFTDIISRASNRMLGGKELSRNREWTATSIDFTTDTWLASQRLKRFPALLRPLAQYWIPEMDQVRRHQAVARRVIKPLMERRLAEEDNRHSDLLQMLWEGARGSDKTPDFMAYTSLAISFAAIRTSSSVPTHLIYDLCARPEYVEPLLEEIDKMLKEEGGRFTKAGLSRLVKLDSFMKESQRFNPLSFLTFGRLLHKDLRLHDGVVIPAGTMIGLPAYAIAHDPQFYGPSPETFDGFRHVGGSAQFVTTNAANLAWGYGKHACSGRFFAAGEIKMIVAYFLLHYDFKFAKEDMPRPANIAFELQNMADPTVEILVRRRERQ
ncbi:cytochrome P450 [Diplogelasinospora grovesii]|uniref:Cytochrome P450 n=1 Tax=Diplogelasinospora grovesii TaxID=303347 RepID=A0AAN6NI48_9PEZI|nr:cytochrome P450 [Diplogelasinospora grovesii]